MTFVSDGFVKRLFFPVLFPRLFYLQRSNANPVERERATRQNIGFRAKTFLHYQISEYRSAFYQANIP